MINGVHLLLYSRDAEADRAFFRDVLNLKAVDAGEGWLIFAMPPTELGVHPGEGEFLRPHPDRDLSCTVAYLMCDNINETIKALNAKGVKTSEVQDAGWGIMTTLRLPGGGGLGLYQPRHATAIS